MRKKRLYVIGYDLDAEYVYGEESRLTLNRCWPMTAAQTKRELKYHDDSVKIYKLVPVAQEDL